ncbi:heparinase II/III family protein [Dentipellis sp. KUC8613]|nr:heparinase II/III family protein [Dentipellis sp. KUC8613]
MASYDAINPQQGASPYGSGDPYYHESSGYITPQKPPARGRKWIWIAVPVAIAVIVAAVVGGVVGSRNHKDSSSSSSSNAAQGSGGGEAAASSAASVKNAIGIFATSTNSDYLMPVYPSTTNTAAFTTPTFNPSNNAALAWPSDPFQPSNPSPTTVRTDRPRLIAPAYKWQALPALIAGDPYLKSWNASIFNNATQYAALPPVVYHMDGSSGILDNAREIKMRLKAFSYVYRMTNDTKWADRAWQEIQNAAGNGTTPFGPDDDKWNSMHFLDTAEFTAAFGIAYDWLHEVLTDDQKSQMISTMIKYGLSLGMNAYNGNASIGWWDTNTEGNWNCVCNGGLTLGALAILGDDTSGIAQQILSHSIDNAKQNCALAVSDDGTWAETANYWYFGTTGHAEMSAALISATGSDYGLLSVNPQFNLTGDFHMYVQGATSLFNYGDHGPNKFSTTANSIIFYGNHYKIPQYMLYQRDQHDAPEPWSMFWYDPTVSGAFWDGLPLDRFFDNGLDQWASMRSSWTDNNALYVAMKAGQLLGHQNHNDLDCGDFVLDAMGTRWAGELGSGDYLSEGYFNGDTQDAERWLYYRKRTEGQNTVLINQQNQNINASPKVNHGSTGETQGSSTVYTPPGSSTAYFVADLTSAYNSTTSLKRGIRTINGRKQVLLQDDINTQGTVMWRMHTNATVSVDQSGTSATLTIGDAKMTMQILNAPSGAQISTGQAQRFQNDPALPAGQSDQENPGVTVVMINLPAGTYNLQVLFNPQWSGMASGDFKTPSFVALDSWSLTSHE